MAPAQGQHRLAVGVEEHQVGVPVAGAWRSAAAMGRSAWGAAVGDNRGGTSAGGAAPAAFDISLGHVVAPAVVLRPSDPGVDEAVDGLVGDDRATGLAGQAAGYLLGVARRVAPGARRFVSDAALMDAATEAVASAVFASSDNCDAENACAPEAAQPRYARARAQGLTLKGHVSEFGGAESLRRTVEILDLDEVQHGIDAVECSDVMRWLAEKGVRLNACPTSNVMLGVVADLSIHPIRQLHDQRVVVTVNTDDLTIFGQSVSDEYLDLSWAGVFTAEELDGIRMASLTSRGG